MLIRYKTNGVPILSAAQIDEQAEQIARKLMPSAFSGRIDSTDLKLLLDYLGDWHYTGKYISKSGSILGLAVFNGGRMFVTDAARREQVQLDVPPKTIMVDRALYQSEFEVMFRFTFAHECGHALYHGKFCENPANMKAYSEQGRERFMADMEENFGVFEERRLKSDYDWLEWQANTFASAVLMPRTLVYQVAELLREREMSETEYMNQLNATIADVFRVSLTAAFYRMKALGIINDSWVRLRGGMLVRA